MSSSLLRPPDAPRDVRRAPVDPVPGDAAAARRDAPPRLTRPRLAALLVAAAAAGTVGGTGVLLATGAVRTGGATTTTVVERTATSTATSASAASATSLDASAIYAAAAPGVVDVIASGASSTSDFGAPGASTATGTGFVTDRSGHIVTAAHVVDGASSIRVTFADGTTRAARVVGRDDAVDAAVLKVDPAGLTLHPLRLGGSASLRAGDPVAVIGDPFGYERSISTGIVSALDRTIEAPNGFTVAHAIQTDAAMNPGNSGGPVLNAAGEVVGIADQIATNGSTESSAGVGFATPIDLVRSELRDLAAGRTVRHAYLGVSTGDATGATAGALVDRVAGDGPAAAAGVRGGDVITALDGTRVRGSGDLVAAIAAHRPGDAVEVTVERGSERVTASITLGAQPTRATPAG